MISEMMALVPDDLSDLRNLNWEHIDRTDVDYFELGVTKILRQESKWSDTGADWSPVNLSSPVNLDEFDQGPTASDVCYKRSASAPKASVCPGVCVGTVANLSRRASESEIGKVFQHAMLRRRQTRNEIMLDRQYNCGGFRCSAVREESSISKEWALSRKALHTLVAQRPPSSDRTGDKWHFFMSHSQATQWSLSNVLTILRGLKHRVETVWFDQSLLITKARGTAALEFGCRSYLQQFGLEDILVWVVGWVVGLMYLGETRWLQRAEECLLSYRAAQSAVEPVVTFRKQAQV